MKNPLALTSLALLSALSACGAYVNPCGTGSPNNPTCPLQSSGSSSSGGSSSSSSSSSGSSSGSSATQAGFSIAGATWLADGHEETLPASLGGTVRRVGAAGWWQADSGAELVLNLAMSGDSANGAQLAISRGGWRYQDRIAGTPLPLEQGSFTPALVAGTEYWFDLAVAADQRSVTLSLPGQTRVLDDPNLAALLGSGVGWQSPAGAFDFAAVWAAADGQASLPAAVYAPYDP
jgi:hypothetical protein